MLLPASITSCQSLVMIHQILPATATRVVVIHLLLPTVAGKLLRSGHPSRIMDFHIHKCAGYLKESSAIEIHYVPLYDFQ